jgi:hypothetical protein
MRKHTETPELVLVAPPEQAAAARRSLPAPEWPAPRRDRAQLPPTPRRPRSLPTWHPRLHRVLLGGAAAVIAGVALATVHHPDAAPSLGPPPSAPQLAAPGGGYVFGSGESFTVSANAHSVTRMTVVVCGHPVTLPGAPLAGNAFAISTKDVRAKGVFSTRRTAQVSIRLRHTGCGTLVRRATARLS